MRGKNRWIKQAIHKKNKVSFLESNKVYIVIIGASILAIILISIILVIDKKGIAKRKAKKESNEEK